MKDFIKNLKFAWKYAKFENKRLKRVIITSLIDVILNVVAPILSARIIISLTSNDYFQIFLIALVILLVNLISNFMYYLTRINSNIIYRSALYYLELDLGKNVLKLENKCLDENGSGVFIQRLTGDTSKIADAFQYLLGLTSSLVRYFGILAALFIVNKVIFIYVVLMLIMLYLLENMRTKKRNEDDKVARKASEKATGFIGELVRGARDIKMLNSESDFMNQLDERIKDANDKKLKMQQTSWMYRICMMELSCIFDFVLIIILILYMNSNLIIPATALVIYNYFSSVHGLAYFFGDFLDYVKDFNLSSQRVYNIINSDEFKKEEFGSIHLDKVKGDFEFKDVSFGYAKKQVLKNLNFKIKANETVAFVGKSGVGKSTIFSLLCKMYDVKKGLITIDNIDINKLDKDSIRGNITIISQDPYIFNMSISDNLKLVKSDLTEKEMKKVCRVACLDDFINKLPDGYDTIIGEGGINLSGGQKQRLAIARALVQKTEIILFDEATSALDNDTQRKIQMAIENMKNKYTILIIAHRLSTIINADRILYLDEGRIKAEGSHDYLLKNCEEYKNLYETEIIKNE